VTRSLPAHEDRIHRRLQVVVDAPPRHAAEELERPRMGVEHHFLALAGIRDHEERAAVTQPHVRHLDHLLDAAELDMLVAPVELVRLARGKALRNERGRARMTPAFERSDMPPDGINGAGFGRRLPRLPGQNCTPVYSPTPPQSLHPTMIGIRRVQ
jgi:hypothetical protein